MGVLAIVAALQVNKELNRLEAAGQQAMKEWPGKRAAGKYNYMVAFQKAVLAKSMLGRGDVLGKIDVAHWDKELTSSSESAHLVNHLAAWLTGLLTMGTMVLLAPYEATGRVSVGYSALALGVTLVTGIGAWFICKRLLVQVEIRRIDSSFHSRGWGKDGTEPNKGALSPEPVRSWVETTPDGRNAARADGAKFGFAGTESRAVPAGFKFLGVYEHIQEGVGFDAASESAALERRRDKVSYKHFNAELIDVTFEPITTRTSWRSLKVTATAVQRLASWPKLPTSNEVEVIEGATHAKYATIGFIEQEVAFPGGATEVDTARDSARTALMTEAWELGANAIVDFDIAIIGPPDSANRLVRATGTAVRIHRKVSTIAPKAEAVEVQTKDCPFCAETIKIQAIKCKHCGSDLPSASS